ncbi:MAG TPA: hypothetical protein VEB43_00825 [Anaeromyxobacter sp.]|nr:hypothetical protein [Anaeromyxobacter sp.]
MARAGTTVDLRRPGPCVWAAVATLLLGACQRDGVRRYIVEKEGDTVPAATAGPTAPRPAVAEGGGVRWTLPAGWQEKQGGGDMRHATLTPPGANAEVTVVRLSGPAGGELANVNRWRNQLGLPPLGAPELAPARKTLGTAAGELAVYDFTSTGAKKLRTVAGLTSVEGETWFFKLTGDADAVASVRPAFLDLLGSLRLEAR